VSLRAFYGLFKRHYHLPSGHLAVAILDLAIIKHPHFAQKGALK